MDEQQRPPSFQFYPRDFLTDRAVALMSAEALGGYVRLLCHAWLGEEPGVLPNDDTTLAALSGLGDRWQACSVSIRRAFRQTSREGREVLVQKRMVEERAAQARRYEQAAEGARVTNAKRAFYVAQRSDNDTDSARPAVAPASASASAVDSKDAPPGAEQVFKAITQIANGVALHKPAPRAPLMSSVRSSVSSLPSEQQKRLYQLAGWLARGGVEDHECVLRFVQDAIPRLPEVRNLFAYYAPGGKARSVIEGHYRADCQERESKRWKDEEWAWARKLAAWKEGA